MKQFLKRLSEMRKKLISKKSSIRYRFQKTALTITFFSGMVIFLLSAYGLSRINMKAAEAYLEDNSAVAYANIENHSDTITQLSVGIIANPVIKNSLTKINKNNTKNEYRRRSEIQSLKNTISKQVQGSVFNIDGIVSLRIYSLKDDEIFVGTTNNEYLEYSAGKGEIIAANGAALWGTAGEKKYLWMARAILSTDTIQPIGYMVIICDPSFMGEALPGKVGSFDTSSYLISKTGMIIASSEDSLIGKKADLDIYRGGKKTARDLYSGRKAYYSMKTGSDEGWILLTTVEQSLLFYEILKLILGFAVIFSLIIIISNIVTKSAVQRLVRPTERLLDGMKKFGEGNLSARVEVSGNDEITELTEAYNSMADQVQNLMEKVYELELSNKQAEIEFLKMQINPHFLYNTLDTMSWMGFSCGSEEITDMAVSLAEILRASIKQDIIIKISDEIRIVEDYLRIQHYRFRDRINAEVSVDEDIRDCYMPGFLLQPLIENSITHGLEGEIGRKGIIVVEGYREDDKILFSVTDNGKGMTEEELKKLIENCKDTHARDSIGIKNVYRRLYMIFGEECSFNIESSPDHGTRVSFKISADMKLN
ncbi:sensor histidine kinase [Lachnospiraceae bacterium C1.1]|nr:histidine kinase [Lachnospiraceae bacterium C1.1]